MRRSRFYDSQIAEFLKDSLPKTWIASFLGNVWSKQLEVPLPNQRLFRTKYRLAQFSSDLPSTHAGNRRSKNRLSRSALMQNNSGMLIALATNKSASSALVNSIIVITLYLVSAHSLSDSFSSRRASPSRACRQC